MAGEALFGAKDFDVAVSFLEVADEVFARGRAFGVAEDGVEAAEVFELAGYGPLGEPFDEV